MDKKLEELKEIEKSLASRFEKIEEVAFYNQKKVLDAFRNNGISNTHFIGTTGYGNTDKGKEALARVYADTFDAEDALVTPHFTCGTHTISVALLGLLRRGDTYLSITGMPYDTIHGTLFGKDNGSLESLGVNLKFVDLKDDCFDEEKILSEVKALKPRVVYVQRSRGYAARKALSVNAMEGLFAKIKALSPESFIVVDNCYGEFIETREPTSVGADVAMGSLIKNPGGGLAPNGGYIVGTKKALSIIERRLTCPSLGRETGSYEMGYRLFYQGFYMAPHIVSQALKGAYLIGEVMKRQGYKIIPDTSEDSFDIIKSIVFKTPEELIEFVQLIQKLSPIDSNAVPIPDDMPGYESKIIMAAGTFVEGASIELSCDSPIRAPYIAYFQGGLTYEQLRIVAYNLLDFKNK